MLGVTALLLDAAFILQLGRVAAGKIKTYRKRTDVGLLDISALKNVRKRACEADRKTFIRICNRAKVNNDTRLPVRVHQLMVSLFNSQNRLPIEEYIDKLVKNRRLTEYSMIANAIRREEDKLRRGEYEELGTVDKIALCMRLDGALTYLDNLLKLICDLEPKALFERQMCIDQRVRYDAIVYVFSKFKTDGIENIDDINDPKILDRIKDVRDRFIEMIQVACEETAVGRRIFTIDIANFYNTLVSLTDIRYMEKYEFKESLLKCLTSKDDNRAVEMLDLIELDGDKKAAGTEDEKENAVLTYISSKKHEHVSLYFVWNYLVHTNRRGTKGEEWMIRCLLAFLLEPGIADTRLHALGSNPKFIYNSLTVEQLYRMLCICSDILTTTSTVNTLISGEPAIDGPKIDKQMLMDKFPVLKQIVVGHVDPERLTQIQQLALNDGRADLFATGSEHTAPSNTDSDEEIKIE
ncbi:hypothetical protein PAPHI01_1297 [Pancytospora philotis]|nr:hypothetical protein PAPHI01_1297 [Pancytospora philotis]